MTTQTTPERDYTEPRTMSVQLKDGVTVEQFRAALLPRLADRTDWLHTATLLDWEGHPHNRDYRFAVEEAEGLPICTRLDHLAPGITCRIVVSFGSAEDGANWAAFSAGYFSRVCDAAFASGACSLSY